MVGCFQLFFVAFDKFRYYFDFSRIFSVNWNTLKLQKLHEAIAKIAEAEKRKFRLSFCALDTKESFIIVRLRVKIIHISYKSDFFAKIFFNFSDFFGLTNLFLFTAVRAMHNFITYILYIGIGTRVSQKLGLNPSQTQNWFLVPNI